MKLITSSNSLSIAKAFIFNLGESSPSSSESKSIANLNLLIGSFIASQPYPETSPEPVEYLAYYMATVKIECGIMFEPVTEFGPRQYFNKYEPGTALGRVLGNTVQGDGFKYRGRGYCQLTGKSNYIAMGNRFGVDLVNDPDMLVKDRNLSFKVMDVGCRRGLFTGKKLEDYWYALDGEILKAHYDFKAARAIINGSDKNTLLARYADLALSAIRENY